MTSRLFFREKKIERKRKMCDKKKCQCRVCNKDMDCPICEECLSVLQPVFDLPELPSLPREETSAPLNDLEFIQFARFDRFLTDKFLRYVLVLVFEFVVYGAPGEEASYGMCAGRGESYDGDHGTGRRR